MPRLAFADGILWVVSIFLFCSLDVSFSFEFAKLLLPEAEQQRLSQARARWPAFSPSLTQKPSRAEPGRLWLLANRTTTAACLSFPDQNQDAETCPHQRCLRGHAWDAQALRLWPARREPNQEGDACTAVRKTSTLPSFTCFREGRFRAAGPQGGWTWSLDACKQLHTPLSTQTFCFPPVSYIFLL